MKKNELKKILKPLIKECIKEVIFEEGTLSTIITEVVRGTSSSQPIVEVKNVENNEKRLLARQEKSKAKRKKMLDQKIDFSMFLIWFINNYPRSTSSVSIENFMKNSKNLVVTN